MKRLTWLMALAMIIVTVAAPAFTQPQRRAGVDSSFASDFQTIPVMGNVRGIGGTFQTYVALLNPTSSAFGVTATLHDSAGQTTEAMITLAAGEQKTYTNFLDEVFDYEGGGAVTFSSGDPANRFIVNAEVRTGGTHFATPIPALEFAGSSSRSYAPGITVGAGSRTNIGCFNQSDAANRVIATVLDASGTQSVGTVTMDLLANAWAQAAVTAVVNGGYIRFDPAEAAACYAVVVDNATNDGRFITATEYEP